MTVRDADDVGGNVGRDVTALSLDDRESGQGSVAEGVRHLCSTFQKTGVKVEDAVKMSANAFEDRFEVATNSPG